MSDPINMIDENGKAHPVPTEAIPDAVRSGWTVETPDQAVSRVNRDIESDRYGGVGGALDAAVGSAYSGATFGATDVLNRAIRGQDAADYQRKVREAHPYISTAANIAGSLAVPGLGEAHAAEGAAEAGSALGRLGSAALHGAGEGALYGVGSGVSDLALSDDPLTMEHAASVLSSHALFGGAVGAAAGTLAKGVELGLGKARAAIAEHAAAKQVVDSIPEDIAKLDRKGLKSLEGTELANIETQRVADRAKLAEDIAAHRQAAYNEERIWQATESVKDVEGVASLGARAAKSDKQLRNILDNPIELAAKPERALSALQRQQSALEGILAKRDTILAAATNAAEGGSSTETWTEFTKARMGEYMKSEGGHAGAMKRLGAEWSKLKAGAPSTATTATRTTLEQRTAAMDAIPGALERNKALQARIADITAAPKSPTLDAIANARDTLAERAAQAAQPKSWAEQMLGGMAFGKAHGTTAAIGTAIGGPIGGLIGLTAPFVGAKASKFISEKLFGRVADASAEGAARITKGIDAFMSVAPKVQRAAPVLATKVLSAVRYAPEREAAPAPPDRDLATSYRRVSDEIRSQTTLGPSGPVMRPEARATLAQQLTPIAAASPVIADRIETIAARRIEFLASKLPLRPSLAGMQIGPDTWRPSDMEMRTFARYVAAVENPHAIVDRLAAGTVTPEDSEALRTVYPEMHADITRQIVERLPELRQTLPYQRRLALSMFAGVPVDASMDPSVLASLQGNFAMEPNTNFGTQAPTPQPQFGSVRAEKPTPAQAREQGTTS